MTHNYKHLCIYWTRSLIICDQTFISGLCRTLEKKNRILDLVAVLKISFFLKNISEIIFHIYNAIIG